MAMEAPCLRISDRADVMEMGDEEDRARHEDYDDGNGEDDKDDET